MSTRLGTISVDLIANTVSFSNAMSKAEQVSFNTARNIQRSLNLIAVGATTMATGVIAALGDVIEHAEEFAFSMQRMAQESGTTSDMFSKLAYNAKLVGVPIEILNTALQRLSRTAGQAQSGNKLYIKAYESIGITMKDLKGPLSNSGDLLVAVSKKLDGYAESTEKTAIEQELLSRGGAQLAPLLHQLATGFDTATQQATLFGVVVGDKTAAQALKLHQSMVQLESVALGFSMRLLSGVAPALSKISDQIINFATSAKGMQTIEEIASGVSQAVTLAGNSFQLLIDHAATLTKTFEILIALRVGTAILNMGDSVNTTAQLFKNLTKATTSFIKVATGLNVLSLGTMISSLAETLGIMRLMVQEEGLVVGGVESIKYAFAGLEAVMLANPITAILSGAALAGWAVYEAIQKDVEASGKLGDAAVEWADYWRAATEGSMGGLIAMKKMLTTFSLSEMQKDWKDFQNSSTFGERVHKYANERLAKKVATDKPAPPAPPKAKAPNMNLYPGKEKVDHLKLKMDELQVAANAARAALADAGKGADFERADEITKEYNKTVVALEAALKVQGKTLSDNDRARIKANIAETVNDLAQKQYRDTIRKTTDELVSRTRATDMMTASIGRSAEAARAAAVAAYSSEQDNDKSGIWKAQNAAARAMRDAAYGKSMDAGNRAEDDKSLLSITRQIDAQNALNKSIMAGKEAQEEAGLAAQQAAIKQSFADRKDTDPFALRAALEANQQLYEITKKQGDLQRAASMNPAQIYLDEARGIRDAADAAKEAGVAIDAMQMKAANKAIWDQYRESIDRTTLAVGNASDGARVFFEQMARDTVSAAAQVHEVLGGAFESLNGVIGKMMNDHYRTHYEFIRAMRNDFSNLFRGVASNLGKIGLHKVEQAGASSILGKLGLSEKKPQVVEQVKTNMHLQEIQRLIQEQNNLAAANLHGMGTGSYNFPGTSVGSAIDGDPLGGLSKAASFLSPFTSMIPGLGFLGGFGGHLALGGQAMAGMTYDVGEMGRERFTPTQNGVITPANKMGSSGSPTFHIDARGSNDPAQTEAAVHRAMSAWAPHIVGASVKAVNEGRMRSPLSAR